MSGTLSKMTTMTMSRHLPRWRTILKLAVIVCTLGYCILLFSWSIRHNELLDDRRDKAVDVDGGYRQAFSQFNPGLINLHVRDDNADGTHGHRLLDEVDHEMIDRLDLLPKSGSTLDVQSTLHRLHSNSTLWRFRRDHLMRLRKKIGDFLGADFLESAFVTRDNTPLNSSVLFYKILPEGMIPVVDDLWVQLPKTSVYSGRQFKTCSVVGSSGILTGRKCGQVIDSTQFVFRMNNAPTSGDFVADVGKRTCQMSETGKSLAKMSLNTSSTFRSTCLPASPFPDELFQDTSKPLPKILLVRLPTYPETELVRLITKGCRVVPKSQGQMVLWDSRINPKLNEFWRQNGLKLKMSSGFFSITMALHLCEETHVFGFWPFRLSPERKTVSYHYHDLLITRKIIHNFAEEFDMLLRLHEHGVIKLHVDDCAMDR